LAHARWYMVKGDRLFHFKCFFRHSMNSQVVDLRANPQSDDSAPSPPSLPVADRDPVGNLQETPATLDTPAATKATKVLLVDDDNLVLDQLERLVTAAGYEVVTARNGDAALLSMQQEFAPIVIAEIDMPQMDGFALCRAIRRQSYSGYVYVILLSSKDAEGDMLTGLDAGADDYVSKRTPTSQLVGRLRTAQRILALEHSLKQALADRERMAMTDVLTGAHNRRYLLQHLSHELDCAQRLQGALSVLVFDVDHFSLVNDRHGHAAGDGVLKEVVRRIQQGLQRSCDWFARLGGDEFAVVLPQTDIAGASIVAEKLRRAVAATPIRFNTTKVRITISIGASELGAIAERDSTTAERLLELADQNLYKSKKSGRNRVTAIDTVDLAPSSPLAARSNSPVQLNFTLLCR
jgi:two-component system, cell cycle response regulator